MVGLTDYIRWSFRFILKYWVRYRVKRYLAFCDKYKHEQSNIVITRAKLMKAKLLYWQSMFSSWGYYDIGGPKNFSYSTELKEAQEDEMMWMGFTRQLRREFEVCKQKLYPDTFDFYPQRYKYSHNGRLSTLADCDE